MRAPVWVPALVLTVLVASTSQAADVAPVWKKRCAGCHGLDGAGHTDFSHRHKIPDLSSPKFQAKHSDAQFRDAIENGIKDTKMPSFKSRLSAEEISGLVAYIRTLKKE